MRESPLLFAVAGPSGVGKSTLAGQLRERCPELSLSVSHTTRPLRGEEEHGHHYYFVSDSEFSAMVEGGQFIEWASVFAHRYGTAKRTVRDLQAAGRDVLLDIDYQGVQQVTAHEPMAVTVLLVPPSMGELESRLRGRQTDSEEQLALRLAKARHELAQYKSFRYVVVNDEVELATQRLLSIYTAERARVERNQVFMERMVQS